MWVICGSPDRFLKEATSTPSALRHVSNVGRQSCHTPCGLAYSVTGRRLLSAPVTTPWRTCARRAIARLSFGIRKTGHRKPTDASDWRKLPSKLLMDSCVTAVTSVGTVIARLYDGVAHLVAHQKVYSRLGNLVRDDHHLRPMKRSIANFYSKWGYIADPRVLSRWTETDLRTNCLHQSDAPLRLTCSFGLLTCAHTAWKSTSASLFFRTSGKETVENLKISPGQLAPSQEKRIKRQQTVSSARCRVLEPTAGFLLASMPSCCRFRPIEFSYSQSVSVSVPQDRIRGSAIAFLRTRSGVRIASHGALIGLPNWFIVIG